MDAAVQTVQVPGLAVADVLIQLLGLILRCDANGIDVGVDAVGQREVHDTVFAAKGHRRFCRFLCQRVQTRATSAGKDHCTISFAIALFSPLTFPDIWWKWFNNVGSARPYFSALSAFLARGLRAGFSAGSAAFSALGLRPRFAGAFSSADAASAFGLRPRFAGAFSSAGAASALGLRPRFAGAFSAAFSSAVLRVRFAGTSK
mgnify:CR=1 FL=1